LTRALAIDIGGTKLAAALVTDGGEILRRVKGPSAGASNGEALFDQLMVLVREVLKHDQVDVCGVGCGGPMSLHGETVSPLNIWAWRQFPLRARLQAALGVPVFVDNDAKALARGEWWLGAGHGLEQFLAMVVSTGVGGGLVVDGRLLHGLTGNAGHIGHVVVEPDGRNCVCGGRGCLEAEVSGPSLRARYGVEPADAPIEARVRCGTMVGRAVASTVALLDVKLAVVAGSVALGYGEVFFTAANAELTARAGLEFARGARIVPAALGDSGPLIGAAAVGFDGFGLAM
jgi:glucokinase